MRIFDRKCPVCRSSQYKVLFHDYNRRDNIDCSGTYVECNECSLIYLKDPPIWEEIVKFYSSLDKDQTANTGQMEVAELRQHAEMVPKWKHLLRKIRFRPHSWPFETVSSGSKRLLDLGCGNGSKLFEFAERGYQVWGVDVSDDAIRLCQEILPQGHFIRGELQDTALPDAHFDYIRIDNALEHVPNPMVVVKECRRLLRHGGQLLIYVPHGRSLSIRLMKGDSISSWIPFHLQLFTRKSLHRLMTENGFEDIRIYGYYPSSWLPLSIVQWKKRKQIEKSTNYSKWLNLACYPTGWLAGKLGWDEELVGSGILSCK